MKKLIALVLAMLAVMSLAACGGTNETTKESEAVQTTAPADDKTPETTVGDAKYVTSSAFSNHENGWEAQAWSEEGSGVYFNMWQNDLPYNEDWSVRYQAIDPQSLVLVRDGQVYQIAGPGIGSLVKFSNNAYYIVCDKWVTQEQFPLQEGDILVIQGDFANPDNGYTIHFEKTYIELKVGGITKFNTDVPESIASLGL